MIIWHNPRCSKSRQALKILHENGQDPEIFEYLKSPPSIDEISELLVMLKMSPRDLMRTKEVLYKELGAAIIDDDSKLIEIMHKNPILIERPVVINEGRAIVGRPPEAVLAII